MTKTTPNEELRELVAEWREASDKDMENNYSDAGMTWAVAAKELEELIEETEDTQKTAGSYSHD